MAILTAISSELSARTISFLLLSPQSRLLSGTILPCTFILVVRGVKANSLALLLQQIWCKATEKTSVMQKSLKGLCLLNNEIALPDSVRRGIALLLSPQAGQGLKDYFLSPSLFFGSSMRRRKLFYLIPLCTEQRAHCVPGNRLSRFGSLSHKAAELCPLLNAPSGNPAREELAAAPSEWPAGLSSCSPGQAGACHLARSDSPFPLQVTAKAAAPSALLASISQDIQQKREFSVARGEMSWREPLSARVGLQRTGGEGSWILPYFGNATSPELPLLVFDGSQEQKTSWRCHSLGGHRAQHHGQQCHHSTAGSVSPSSCHGTPGVPTPPQGVPTHHTRAAPRPSPTAGRCCPFAGWK